MINSKEKALALDFIESNKDEFISISHKIWEYAELSLKEYKSAELYINKLKSNGFEVEENLCGIKTAFLGKFGSGKPVIGILGEFDALSGLSQKGGSTQRIEIVKNGTGHGCGHNMLGAASLGAAIGIKNYLETNKIPGTVIFYGCPGEEGGASKAVMARDGLFDDLDAALSWHPGDSNEVSFGTCNSCVQTIYKFTGVASHAAGNPEAGRSALDAAELLNIGVQFLREHVKGDARIHYSFLNAGGPSPNVVQPTADVLYMIRSKMVKDVLLLEKRVDKIAQGAAMMTETEVEKIFVDGCSNTVQNTVLQGLLYKNMESIGVPQYTEEEEEYAKALKSSYEKEPSVPGMGAMYDSKIESQVKELSDCGNKALNDFLYPLCNAEAFSPGSTDVGDVSWNTPTAQFNAVSFPSNCPGHSWQNVSCGVSSIGDKSVLFAAKVLCATAIDLFDNEDIIQEATKEFKTRTENGYYCPVPDGASLFVIE